MKFAERRAEVCAWCKNSVMRPDPERGLLYRVGVTVAAFIHGPHLANDGNSRVARFCAECGPVVLDKLMEGGLAPSPSADGGEYAFGLVRRLVEKAAEIAADSTIPTDQED